MPDPAPTTRAHAAAKRYIYAWGDGRAEGNGSMKDLPAARAPASPR